MAKYPIFLNLSGRRAVIIGGGAVAMRKAKTLLDADARLVVVADNVEQMLCLDSNPNFELIKSKYSKDYLSGAVLVIAATNDHKLNETIYKDCQQLEILCNVVDQPELCDFFVPAVVKRDGLQLAVGTEGNCPAYAGHIRKKLEAIFTEAHGEFLSLLEQARKKIINDIADSGQRKTILGRLVDDESFQYFIEKGPKEWNIRADEISKQVLSINKA
jgi:precorrin-2 dehydrogenase/sirohydrochlorin ferrochelatase